MLRNLVLVMLLCVLCLCAWTQEEPPYKEEERWQAVCEQAKAKPLTPIQPQGPLKADQLKNCDETALYYGIGQAPDYSAALQCGWYQRAHPQNNGNMFHGPGVLTMLYANGKGAERNYDLAIRFACENQWAAEAEMEGRIGHLEYLRAGGASKTGFDLCEDTTSGLSDGFCTSIRTRKEDAARTLKINASVKALPAAARKNFPRLEAAERAFEKARVENEVDLSGTSRGAFSLREESRLRDQFLINLDRFARGDIPQTSADELAALDQTLNEVYQQIQRAPESKWYGTVNPEGIRNTERKWVALVDAWMEFAQVAYPDLMPTSVRAQLIRLRLHQLRSLTPR